MHRGEHRSVAALVVGCCLLLACSGCFGTQPTPGLILQRGWSLDPNRVPPLDSQSTAHEESSQSDGGGGTASPARTGRDVPFPTEAAPKTPGLEQTDCQTPCPPDSYLRRGGPICGGGRRVCGMCGRLRRPVEPAVEVGYQNHPRFHPVPTRPAFSPRLDQLPVPLRDVIPNDFSAPELPPEGGSPQIQVIPPAPPPEQIPTPEGEAEDEGRMTRAPKRPGTTSHPASWIFNPPTPPEPDPTAEAQANAKETPRWIRRR